MQFMKVDKKLNYAGMRPCNVCMLLIRDVIINWNIFRQLLKFILLPCRWFMRLPSKTLFFFYQKGESSLFHMLTYLSNLFWQNKSHVNMILKYDISIWYNNIVTMHIDQSLIIKNIIKLHSKSHLHAKITI